MEQEYGLETRPAIVAPHVAPTWSSRACTMISELYNRLSEHGRAMSTVSGHAHFIFCRIWQESLQSSGLK